MLERVVDLDTGRYSELGACILYVMRLAVQIESYIRYLVETNRYQNDPNNNHKVNGAFEHAYVRGLQCDQAALAEAEQHQINLRTFLETRVFKVIARWTQRA